MSQTILAFDFGLKNIGMACGQDITKTANELKPIPAKNGTPNWEQLETLINEWQPSILLVGLPLNMDGSEMEFTARAKKFGKRLHGRFGKPVEMVDERLTTRAAKEEAFERGHRGHFASSPVDSIAARLILESWFNDHSL
ncbi:MAG: Holliday junction resolvase RuvX [Cellvibrionaceae bacterium]